MNYVYVIMSCHLAHYIYELSDTCNRGPILMMLSSSVGDYIVLFDERCKFSLKPDF